MAVFSKIGKFLSADHHFAKETRHVLIEGAAVLTLLGILQGLLVWQAQKSFDRILFLRGETFWGSKVLEAIADIKKTEKEAQDLSSKISVVFPDSEALFEKTSSRIRGLASKNGLQIELIFGAEGSATQDFPRNIELNIRAIGPLANLISFVEDFESEPFLFRTRTVEFVGVGGDWELKVKGLLFMREE